MQPDGGGGGGGAAICVSAMAVDLAALCAFVCTHVTVCACVVGIPPGTCPGHSLGPQAVRFKYGEAVVFCAAMGIILGLPRYRH